MKKRALLIGGTGFVGLYLQRYLQNDYNVIAVGRNIDVRIKEQLQQLIATAKPDVVVHLAAISSIPESFNDPYGTYNVNFIGTLNLLTVLHENQFKGRMLFIGSSQVYGWVADQKLPVPEEMELKPRNPYAVSKVAAEALCYQWSQSADFDVIMARPFNHIGPGQSERFVVSDFARQIVKIKHGLEIPNLRVGDIDVLRDFTDVRDVIRAYSLLLERGRNGEAYNVCSEREVSIRFLLSRLLEHAGVTATIELDQSRMRSSEQRRIYGCYKKLKGDTGWEPQISIEKTLEDILIYWEEKLL